MKKTILTKLLIISTIFFTSHLVLGQSSKDYSDKEKQELIELYKSIEGTYQIQLIDVRYVPSMHISFAETIIKNRKKTEDNYVQFNSDIRILILSEDSINSAGFKPVDRIKYISSNALN